MFEVKNRRSYYLNFGIFSVLIAVVLFALFIFESFNTFILVFIFLLLEFIFISKKNAYKISVDNRIIRITYYKWLKKKELRFNVKEIQIQIEDMVGIYGHKYKILKIYFRGKNIYSIDTSTDFSNIDIERLSDYFNKKNN